MEIRINDEEEKLAFTALKQRFPHVLETEPPMMGSGNGLYAYTKKGSGGVPTYVARVKGGEVVAICLHMAAYRWLTAAPPTRENVFFQAQLAGAYARNTVHVTLFPETIEVAETTPLEVTRVFLRGQTGESLIRVDLEDGITTSIKI